MFKNIGHKIKILALVLFWISVATCAISAIISFVALVGINPGLAILSFVLIAGLGFLFSWIGSFFMYGFGQLIDDTEINRRTNQQILRTMEGGAAPAAPAPNVFRSEPAAPYGNPVPPVAPAPAAPAPAAPVDGWFCSSCGAKNESSAIFCRNCGTPRGNA